MSWKFHCNLPVFASSLTIELVYRFGPGRLDPQGRFESPGNGAGLPTPKYIEPLPSQAGVYQAPPRDLISGGPHRVLATVSKFHSFLPVFASNAQRATTP